MMTDYTKRYLAVANAFALEGNVLRISPYGSGHINLTLLVVTDKRRYIMQKMNTNVFPDSDALMSNICSVTQHLKGRGVETLDVIYTKDGKSYLKGEDNYRVYAFIEGTVTYQRVPDGNIFYNAGRAFGEFQNHLASFDASRLVEVIPRFHDTPKRYQDFLAAAEADSCMRAATCRKDIAFVKQHESTYGDLISGLKGGTLPLAVTHNDTKVNNILMDERTGKGRAIIDLDTIMPGSRLYDFGDSIRSGATSAAEDEQDLSRVHFDLSLFEAYASGFCSALRGTLTQEEKELLPYSAYLMTVECGMRFLADYLAGDTYFATSYSAQNLVRCRSQLALAAEMESARREMATIIKKVAD